MQKKKRSYGRSSNELRPLSFTYGFSEFSHGSVLLEVGRTKVLCSVNLTHSVPHFLKGKKRGWLTAEYAMLPSATMQRTDRESNSFKRNGRSVEISRLIGRAFRSVVDLQLLGERTIVIDCDVIQADGSTRTACITGAYFALQQAMDYWIQKGIIDQPIMTDEFAAVSIGVRENELLLDVDFAEDSSVDADFNFVMTRLGAIIELQGSAEKTPIPWDKVVAMREIALQGIEKIFSVAQKASCSKGKQQGAALKKSAFNPIRLTFEQPQT